VDFKYYAFKSKLSVDYLVIEVGSVLVSSGCCNKLSHGWVKTIQIYSFIVMEARSLNWFHGAEIKVSAELPLWREAVRMYFLAFSSFWSSIPCIPWLMSPFPSSNPTAQTLQASFCFHGLITYYSYVVKSPSASLL
jgi:hypothetical protein